MSTKKRISYKHASRSSIVKMIGTTAGKIFTVIFTKKDGTERKMNCNKKKDTTSAMGYITVWDMQKHAYRNVDPRTITGFSFKGKHYRVK